MTKTTRHLWLLVLALLVGVVACGSPSSQKVGSDPGNLNGDVTGAPWANTVVALRNISVPTPSGSNVALLYNAGAFSWGSAGSSFTAGGDLSGTSSSQTVIGLQGRAVSSSAPTTGYSLVWGGSSWAPSLVSLSSGVTGNLPVGNIAPGTAGQFFVTNSTPAGAWITPGGDVTASTSSPGSLWIQSLSGPNAAGTAVTLDTVGLAFAANITSPSIIQTAQTSDVATQNLLIESQGPWASASTHKSPGNILFNTPAPVSGGSTGFSVFQSGGTNYGAIGLYNSTAGDGALWLGVSSFTTGNWTLLNTGSATQVDAGSTLYFDISGSAQIAVVSGALEPYSDATATAGTASDRWTSVNAASSGFNVYHAAGASNPVAELGDSSGSGTLALGTTGSAPDAYFVRQGSAEVQFSNGLNGDAEFDVGGTSAHEFNIISSSATIKVANTSSSSSTDMTLQPQQSAQGTNETGGNLVVALQAPIGTGSEAFLKTTRGGSTTMWLGPDPLAPTTDYGFWFGTSTPTSGNWTFLASANALVFLQGTTEISLAGGGLTTLFDSTGIHPNTSGQVSVGTASSPFGGSFFGAASGTTYYSSFESSTGTNTGQTGHVRREQAFYEQTSTGLVTAASGAAGTIFCPPSNTGYHVDVKWDAKAPYNSTPTGTAGGRTWAECYNSGSSASCGTNVSDTTSTNGSAMCSVSGPGPPTVTIASGSSGCFLVQVNCPNALDLGDINYDFEIMAIHN